jgi:type I restriction enzyme, S subunit
MRIQTQKVKYCQRWGLINLDDISLKISDGTHFTPTYTRTGVAFISVKDIYNDTVYFNNCKFIDEKSHFELIQRCHPEEGDLLLTKSGTIGRMAIVPKKPPFSLFVSVALIKNKKWFIDSKFLKFCLENFFNSINIGQDIKGGLLKNFHLEDIRATEVPVPSLPEQHRIVAKIEELFSELDKGVEALKTAQQQLKVYRQAVLKWAFEGKLTEEWRKSQKDLPTASQLLEQIETEREKQAEAGGKRLKPVVPLTDEELAELPVLSKRWCWVKIDTLSENEPNAIKAGPFGSSLKKEYYVEEGYKIYGQEQVISEDPYYGDYFISEKKYKSLISNKVKPGDVLISLVGTIGKVLILPDNAKPGIINPRLIKISIDSKWYLSKFFKFYFESSFLKRIYGTESQGTTMNILNMGIIKALPFPFVCIEEQHAIVAEIETRLSVADKVEETITQSLQQAEALRQSILKKAFAGKLVPQDPNDEPAEKLLERIKAERVSQATVKRVQ